MKEFLAQGITRNRQEALNQAVGGFTWVHFKPTLVSNSSLRLAIKCREPEALHYWLATIAKDEKKHSNSR